MKYFIEPFLRRREFKKKHMMYTYKSVLNYPVPGTVFNDFGMDEESDVHT